MKKSLLKILALATLYAGTIPEQAIADNDIIKVQTLTFDSIITRRGTWTFPNNDDKFRKIIMNYTLKCDPKTAHDKFNCGEWDYLTYTLLHHNTGRDTTYPKVHHKYKLGNDTTSNFKIIPYGIKTPPEITRTFSKTNINVLSAVDDSTMEYATPTEPIITGQKPIKVQFLIPNAELKSNNFNRIPFGKLKLYFSKENTTLKNLKIKMKTTLQNPLKTWESDMITVYDNDYTSTTQGWNDIVLNQDFLNKSVYGLVVEISADGFEQADASLLGVTGQSFESIGTMQYFKFDGTNDYVYCESPNILKNASKFSMEAYVRIDKWRNWAKLLGVGDKLHFETGDSQGDLYFMVRNGMNSYGKSSVKIQMKTWVHIAVTYDGTKEANVDKLQMYINGEKVSLTYAGVLPQTTYGGDGLFTVSSLDWESACVNAGIRDVRVWDTNLSAEDISNWYNRSINIENHPKYSNLILNYTFDNISEFDVKDSGPKANNGKMFGLPDIETMTADELFELNNNSSIPALQLVTGKYQREIQTQEYTITSTAPMLSLAEYEIVNHKPVIKKISKAWAEGYYYTYDINGVAKDSVFRSGSETIQNETLKYMTAPTKVIQDIEIGRFITPYGIGLDLGPDGFTWLYDVTDYADYLKGEVEMSAGNLQELIDISFDFYKGVPPREVVKMTELWGPYGDYKYKDLDDDKVLSEVSIPIDPATKQTKLKTRLTGHGHYSNTGEYPHCCEWKDNTHEVFINGNYGPNWKIWQENDCALNPVYPQGGTWPGSREGWCPGDVVKEYEFEITKYLTANSMSFDYQPTPVPSSNIKMGEGNYIMAMQLIEYGENTHQIDAEIYDVYAPNNFPLYSRQNPLCAGPKVVIRNNGTENLATLKFNYGVSGGTQESFSWTGSIAPHIKDTINLPISSSLFWMGDSQKKFNVAISEPNGSADQYTVNDYHTTNFDLPDIIETGSSLILQTPKKYSQYIHLTIKDMNGNIVLNRNNVSDNKNYTDKLNLPEGCYTMEIISDENIGISYGWVTDYDGSLKLYKPDGTLAKAFKGDFGRSIVYSFSIGSLTSVQDAQQENLMSLYPNPALNELNCRIDENMGKSTIEIFNSIGELVSKQTLNITQGEVIRINTENLTPGNYHIRISNGSLEMKKNFIRK